MNHWTLNKLLMFKWFMIHGFMMMYFYLFPLLAHCSVFTVKRECGSLSNALRDAIRCIWYFSSDWKVNSEKRKNECTSLIKKIWCCFGNLIIGIPLLSCFGLCSSFYSSASPSEIPELIDSVDDLLLFQLILELSGGICHKDETFKWHRCHFVRNNSFILLTQNRWSFFITERKNVHFFFVI